MNSGPTDAAPRPSDIGGYEDWPAYIRCRPRHIAETPAGQELSDALGVPDVPAHPNAVLESEETHDGVTTSRVSWQLGFGPRTRAWFLRPAVATGPLPGVLALHCHAGIKSRGADRLVDARLVEANLVKAEPVKANLPDGRASTGPLSGDRAAEAATSALQQRLYGGRPFATWLASQGFAVLAHDTSSWGSRRFDLSTPPWRTSAVVAGLPGVDGKRLGSIGFSGGGGRSLMLAALSPLVRSFVVTCMMTTYRSLFPSYVDAHSWLLQTPGLGRLGEYPELAERPAADSFLVQYALADELYPEAGMRDADAILRAQTVAGRYSGSFWPGGHAFTTDMQVEAAGFLRQSLFPAPRLFARQNGHQ